MSFLRLDRTIAEIVGGAAQGRLVLAGRKLGQPIEFCLKPG
jgi:hypothetical protein